MAPLIPLIFCKHSFGFALHCNAQTIFRLTLSEKGCTLESYKYGIIIISSGPQDCVCTSMQCPMCGVHMCTSFLSCINALSSLPHQQNCGWRAHMLHTEAENRQCLSICPVQSYAFVHSFVPQKQVSSHGVKAGLGIA